MLDRHLLTARVASALLLVMSGIADSGSRALAQGEERRPRVDADGTLHVPAVTMPPSDLVSAEFKKAYVRRIEVMRAFPQVPAMTAPKAEWDQFDAAVDRLLQASLTWNLEHYPVDVLDTEMAGVRVGVITPKGGIAPENRRRVLINLHGGGFFTGRGLVKGQVESIPVASIGRIRVITIDYRQAPDHQYPAASEDVEAVYRELLKQHPSAAIGIFGCSAGGVLTAQTLAWLQAKGLPRPGAAGILCAALSPFAHLRGDSAIWGSGGIPSTIPASGSRPSGYLESADINDPKAYPDTSDAVLAKFPPTLLLSGTRSGEMSAAIVAHARLLKLGVDSYLYIMEGGWHGAVDSAEDTPEGRDANAYIAHWFSQHLAP